MMNECQGNENIEKLALKLSELKNQYFINLEIPIPSVPNYIRVFVRSQHPKLETKALHGPFLLIVALNGVAGITVDKHFIRLKPGNALLVFPYQIHHYSALERCSLLWFFCGFELQNYEHILSLKNNPVPIGDEIKQNLKWIMIKYLAGVNALHRFSIGNQICWRISLLLEQLLEAQKAYGNSNKEPDEDIPLTRSYWLLYKACQYMSENMTKDISVKDIALNLSISPGHLRNIFHHNMAVGPQRYLCAIRMHFARNMIDFTDDSMENIGLRCGYNSLAAFSRAFKKDIGISPSAYRRKMRTIPNSKIGSKSSSSNSQ